MNSIKVDGISMSFQNLLAKICFHHHFSGKQCHSDNSFIPQVLQKPTLHSSQSLPAQGLGLQPSSAIPSWNLQPWRGPDFLPSVAVVERVDSCASMYSRSIQGHHVCLLVKKVRS